MCDAIKKILLDIVAFTHILTLQIPPLNLSPFILSLNRLIESCSLSCYLLSRSTTSLSSITHRPLRVINN